MKIIKKERDGNRIKIKILGFIKISYKKNKGEELDKPAVTDVLDNSNKVVDVLLVNPFYPSHPNPYLPVGLGYLAKSLQKNNISYMFLDLKFDSFEKLKQTLYIHKIKYVLFSLTSLDIEYNYEIIKNLKKEFPDIIILAGGPHVSFIKDEILLECPAIDYAFAYEGEYSVVDFLNKKSINEIDNLIYRNTNNQIVYNRKEEKIEDLDAIDFPTYDGFNIERYGESMPICSSRGCPFQCIFCGAHLSMGKKWRARSAQNIYNELEYWVKNGYNKFRFIDSNFMFSIDRVKELRNLIKKNQMKITCQSDGIRAHNLTQESIDILKDLGLKNIAIGIENIDNDVLLAVKKGEKSSHIINALNL